MNTTLYPGIPFSPQAQLTNNIGAADTIIEVSDVSAFPPAPNLATIGTDEEGETILYTAKTETALSGCQRGVEGESRGWTAGELIGRNFTAKDHADLIAAATEAYGTATAAQEAAGNAMDAAQAAQETADAAGAVAASKQPKLTGQPGQSVGFDADGAAVAVQGWSNPNLLDNWYFVDPVNQRGQTEYVSQRVQSYTIDRWISAGDSTPDWGLYLMSGGIKLLKGSAFQQKQESPPADGTVLTFSVMIDGNIYAITFTWDSSTAYIATSQSNGFALARNGVNGYVQIFNQNGTGSEIVQAAKLELGSKQTLAHQDTSGNWVLNDPPPNKALELAKCQRYYFVSGVIAAKNHTDDYMLGAFTFPTTMRIPPVISIKRMSPWFNPDTLLDITKLAAIVLSKDGFAGIHNSANSFVDPGNYYYLEYIADANL